MELRDLINGSFELLGGFFLLINIYKLLQDKKIQGVSVWPVIFFTSWGMWNLYYYPSLNQWWSFVGGLSTVIVNGLWIVLAIYYSRRNSNV